MLTIADKGEGGGNICQNLADFICERSLRLPFLRVLSKFHNQNNSYSKSLIIDTINTE